MKGWTVTLTLLVTTLIFAVSVLAQGSAAADPFSAYADLLSKDQAIAAMRGRKFSCIEVFPESRHECMYELEDDDRFSRIYLSTLRGVPQSVAFEVKKDTIHVGDLILLWGRPDVLFPHSAPRLLWQDQDGTTISALVPSADRLTHFAPVWNVSFTF